ncbi:hypothetical protein [uncultured Christiangramia sp.]|uniref:hypothetical protein n=1 Tax=Christiangramia sp. 3-2217-3z TaxID=3417564 RepID=UPI0026395A62|nr:hypothetical protein [uncultured Christiangramia sp.]
MDIAHKILSQRDDFHTNLSKDDEQAMKDILRLGNSAVGALPKAIIAYIEKTKEFRSGQTNVTKGFRHWFIKLDVLGMQNLARAMVMVGYLWHIITWLLHVELI